jgi:adenosine kinase
MRILLTGSVAYDYLMTFPGLFKDQILPEMLEKISLSFLVDSMSRQRGGVAPNIAYTMAMLGFRSQIMATVGEDFNEYRQFLETAGVDTTLMETIPGLFTASFFVTTDKIAAQMASFYPGAMSVAAKQSILNAQQRPDLVVISPNAPEAMTKFVSECHQFDIPYLYDPSQQILRFEGSELMRDMTGAQFLFVNDYEFELIVKKSGWSLAQFLEHIRVVVVTRGKEGATVYTGDKQYFISPVPSEQIVDPTGVGDAFRGGFLVGYTYGFDWKLCGEIGSLAAVYCLEHKGPQNHVYSRSDFVARFRRYFDDGGKLDEILQG